MDVSSPFTGCTPEQARQMSEILLNRIQELSDTSQSRRAYMRERLARSSLVQRDGTDIRHSIERLHSRIRRDITSPPQDLNQTFASTHIQRIGQEEGVVDIPDLDLLCGFIEHVQTDYCP